MGFAAGVSAGTNFMSKLQENERANRVEGRAEEEHDYTKSERERKAAARAAIPLYGLNTDSPVTPVSTVPPTTPAGPAVAAAAPEAPPTSVAATAGTGVPPEAPAGTQLRVAAAQAVPEAAPALGLGTPGGGGPTVPPAQPTPGGPPTAAQPAAAQGTPGVDPNTGARTQPAEPLSEDMHRARAMFNYAVSRDDVAGMNAARADIRTTAMRDYTNKAGKMNDDEAFKYVHENLTMEGGMPISIAKTGKNGYTMMSWDKDGDSRVSTLNGAQIKQLVAADLLMKNGFADEGLKVAAGVHKDLNDLIGKMNTSTQQQATTNNTATHYGNTEAETSRHNRSSEANAAAGLQLRKDAATAEKFQNAETFQDKDGNTYKQVFQTNKGGKIESKVFKIGGEDGQPTEVKGMPAGVKHVSGAGGAGKTAADKVATEPGTTMQRADGSRYKDGGTDSVGNRIELGIKAVLPEARTETLVKGGMPAGAAEQMQWTTDGPVAGQHVFYNGKYYSATRPNDPGIEQLRKDYIKDQKTGKVSDEIATRYQQDRSEYEHPERARKRVQQTEEDVGRSANPMFN